MANRPLLRPEPVIHAFPSRLFQHPETLGRWPLIGEQRRKIGEDRPRASEIRMPHEARISWMVGQRDAGFASAFLQDVESRLANRIQLTTDGHKMYLTAVADAFGPSSIDSAMLVKIYGKDLEGNTRYSPATCIGAISQTVTGNPDPKHVSTSYVERQNLNMRMGVRRFTRLTTGFSKKIENRVHMIAIWHTYYNSARVHQTLRVTPAMEAGISQHVWTMGEIVTLLGSQVKLAA